MVPRNCELDIWWKMKRKHIGRPGKKRWKNKKKYERPSRTMKLGYEKTKPNQKKKQTKKLGKNVTETKRPLQPAHIPSQITIIGLSVLASSHRWTMERKRKKKQIEMKKSTWIAGKPKRVVGFFFFTTTFRVETKWISSKINFVFSPVSAKIKVARTMIVFGSCPKSFRSNSSEIR